MSELYLPGEVHYTGDQLRFCDGCSEWRHKTMFVLGRKYCRVCYAASLKRLDDALRAGHASQSELILPPHLELTRPIQPSDHVSYTVRDDVPDLTTDDLNARVMGTPESWLEDPPS
jgi:hypothetical protein